MEESILKTIRKKVGLTFEDDSFDEDLLVEINSCCSYLFQLGVSCFEDFTVDGVDQLWSDLKLEVKVLSAVKKYMWIRAKLAFDPPTNSFLVENLKQEMREAEWRINDFVDP